MLLTNKRSLQGVDSKKIMLHGQSWKPAMDWRNEKENKGKFTWTLALYGTVAMAKEAKLSEKEYWNQIIKACFLEKPNPITEWKRVSAQVENYKNKLNKLKIDRVHIEGPDADLWIKIGKKRAWNGGSGRNIPSFEIFTSPDWRGTNGWIRFNQPLYRYGNLIEGIRLEFKNGKVVKSQASKVSKKEWERLGYNNSSVHTDIISTAPRTVTAYLPNGGKRVIYKNGQFTL